MIEPPGDAAEQVARQPARPVSSRRDSADSPLRRADSSNLAIAACAAFCGLGALRLDDAFDGAVEQRSRHDRLIDECDGGEVRLERAGHGHRKIRRDVVLGAHRQVDDDILDHDAPRLPLAGEPMEP